MKKKLLAMLLVFGMSLAMGGCAAATKEADSTKESSTVSETSKVIPGAEGGKIITTVEEDSKAEETTLQVFVAASLKNVMEEVAKQYKELHPEVTLAFNADSSGTLQKQIEEGAACDVFFSAAMKQMKALDEGGFVEEDSIDQLLENKVVLIKPKGTETKVTGFENVTDAANLTMGGEDVPLGAYAREIFTHLGILDDVMAMEINEGANVSVVLAAVSEGSNEVGVVYATDAYSAPDSVEIIAEAPEGSLETPVIYPVGLIKNEEADEVEQSAAQDFINYLKTDEIIRIFENYGFSKNE